MNGTVDSRRERFVRVPRAGWLLLAGLVLPGVLLGIVLRARSQPTQRALQEIERVCLIGPHAIFHDGTSGFLLPTTDNPVIGQHATTVNVAPEWLRSIVDKQWLKPFDRLTKVDLAGFAADDRLLAALGDVPDLEQLDLRSTHVTDAGMVHLERLMQLRTLRISGPDVSNAISGTHVTDAGLAHLEGLEDLEVLELSRLDVTDRGLRHLAGLTNLRELGLGQLDVTDEGMRHLAGLANLRELQLGRLNVTDAGLVHLAGLTNLKELWLNGLPIDGSGLKHLSRMTELEELYLSWTKVTDDELVHLAALTNLQSVSLVETPIRGDGLQHLTGLKHLQTINLDDTGASAEEVERFRRQVPNSRVYNGRRRRPGTR